MKPVHDSSRIRKQKLYDSEPPISYELFLYCRDDVDFIDDYLNTIMDHILSGQYLVKQCYHWLSLLKSCFNQLINPAIIVSHEYHETINHLVDTILNSHIFITAPIYTKEIIVNEILEIYYTLGNWQKMNTLLVLMIRDDNNLPSPNKHTYIMMYKSLVLLPPNERLSKWIEYSHMYYRSYFDTEIQYYMWIALTLSSDGQSMCLMQQWVHALLQSWINNGIFNYQVLQRILIAFNAVGTKFTINELNSIKTFTPEGFQFNV